MPWLMPPNKELSVAFVVKCEAHKLLSQSWNIKFPSSTQRVLIAEVGEGTNARG